MFGRFFVRFCWRGEQLKELCRICHILSPVSRGHLSPTNFLTSSLPWPLPSVVLFNYADLFLIVYEAPFVAMGRRILFTEVSKGLYPPHLQPLCGIQVTPITGCKNLGSSDCGPSIYADFILHGEMVYSYYIFSLKTCWEVHEMYMNFCWIFDSCKLSVGNPFPMCL